MFRQDMQPIVLDDFSGGVWRELSGSAANNTQAREMWNYLVEEKTLKKRGGCYKYNGTEIGAGLSCIGLHQFPYGGDYRIFAKFGDSIYEVQPVGASAAVLAGLDANAYVNFVNWAGLCFCADGVNLYSAEGAGFSAVTWLDENGNPTADWILKPTPKSLVLHKEHLWWIDAGSSRVGFTVRNYYDRIWENTVSANNYGSWVACDADDGRELVALAGNGDELMAFKRQKYFLITGDYDATSNTLAVISGDMVGAYNQNSVDACSDGFIRWIGPDGVFEYRRDAGVRPISQAIDYDLRMIAPNDWDTVCAKFWNRYFLVFWTYNNKRIGAAFDTIRRCWMPLRDWDVAVMARFQADDTLYAGWQGAGYVKRLFYGLTDDGAAISCYRKSHKIAVPKMQMVLDGLRCLLRSGQNVMITAVNENGRTKSKAFTLPDIGTYLADEDHPEWGGFELADEEDPEYTLGDIMVSEDELGQSVGEKAGRFPGSFEFRFLEVITQESSVDPHEVERIELDVYPGRQV